MPINRVSCPLCKKEVPFKRMNSHYIANHSKRHDLRPGQQKYFTKCNYCERKILNKHYLQHIRECHSEFYPKIETKKTDLKRLKVSGYIDKFVTLGSEHKLELEKERDKAKNSIYIARRNTLSINKCIYCGKPSMPNDNICSICSSD